MKTKSALAFAEAHRNENLDRLISFLSIPSISTSPEYQPDIERAANWLVAQMKAMGFNRARTFRTPGHPIVYGEWTKAGKDAPTLLVYGHYDVQPTDPDDEWLSPPFKPTIRGENIYARGASDDKGQLYTHLAAAEAFFGAGSQPPVNLKFLIEGEEETGSTNLGPFVEEHAEMLRCDVAAISDTEWVNPATPTIVYGVRGLAYLEIEIRGPKSDLHSGLYGGAVHNPLQVAAEMLAALHDEQGRVTIPGFYDKVRLLSDEERAELARVPFDEEELRAEVGAPALWEGEKGYTLLERTSVRPTLEIHGIGGGFTGAGSKTVIPAWATAKVSMRLVPDQKAAEIADLFTENIHRLAPPTVRVTVRRYGMADPAVIERDTPPMQAAVRALRRGFDAEPVFVRSGGTIPIVTMLNEELNVPVVMMGFGLPDDNLHAPNEKLNLDHFYRGISTVIHFMTELAGQS